MRNNHIEEMKQGFETACINLEVNSNLAYKPQFVSNNYKEGRKVLSSIENELLRCDEFFISVAFITMSGLTPLLQTLKVLEEKKIPGKILTTDYLNFTEPKALKKIASLSNIELKMYQSNEAGEGFHTKGYIFREEEIYRIIVGSSNVTMGALTKNKEWNTQIISTEQGEYANRILEEFNDLWSSTSSRSFEEFIEQYEINYELIKKQKVIAKQAEVTSIEQYKLQPNKMQVAFIANLRKICMEGKDKALLISATGTGKTYASAFALRDINPKKALFLVHREQIAKQAIKSYKRVFGDSKTFGLLSGTSKDYDADYLFSTMQMMAKQDTLDRFSKDEFDTIIIDEVHRAGADSYKRIMEYFTPSFWLGMTASPDRTDGFDIYELFDHNIVYEIRLQQALEENLLCPFHYFGITDLEIDGQTFDDTTGVQNFNNLVCEERVNYIIEKMNFYSYCGDRVKGLVFCSRKDEARELSKKFNIHGYRTDFLSGDDSQERREECIERLTNDDGDDQLDYIFTVDIFNEGVDIPEINQVIMLRPTQSPIVFIQQLGRGLRKADNKEYVVILDFIGNYMNNFMIPIALSGDRSYNKDTIRRYVMEGARILPGSSTIHFDEISKKRIFSSIDSAKTNTIQLLKAEYQSLKNKLGYIPNYEDFEEYGAIDMILFFENNSLGSYHEFLKKYEDDYHITFSKVQEEMLIFVSDKIAKGKRLEELSLLKRLLAYHTGLSNNKLMDWFKVNRNSNALKVLTNEFVTSEINKKKYARSVFVKLEDGLLEPSKTFQEELMDPNFKKSLNDLIDFGIRRNQTYYSNRYKNTNFVLYQKYTYEDVCRLLNWDTNVVAQNIGGYKYDEETNTFPVFINYNKDESINASIRYEDRFVNQSTIIALSKQPRTIQSKDVQQIIHAKENGTKIYLFVRKNKDDNISKEFYFLGEIEPTGELKPIVMKDTDKNAVEITYHLETPVREDIYEYINS
ncbi:DUF3427 domain-containing protein [Anaerosporobacter sp.]